MKDTIVFIHGMWGTARVWHNFKSYFEASGYTCLAPTLRFHDIEPDLQGDAGLGRVSLLEYIHDLEDQIGALKSKPIIMGHSMGGLLAQMLAERGLAKSLVLLAAAPPAGLVISNFSSIRSLFNEIVTPGFWNKPVRITYRGADYGLLNLCPEDLKKELFDSCVYESGRATFEIVFWFFDRRKVTVVDERKVTCPTIVIAGKEDHIIPAPIARRIAHKYAAVAEYHELENHAHWLLAEPGWKDVAGIVSAWISGDGSRRPIR